jgi:hypothetical protein
VEVGSKLEVLKFEVLKFEVLKLEVFKWEVLKRQAEVSVIVDEVTPSDFTLPAYFLLPLSTSRF